MSKYPYPYVECAHNEPPAPGYVVCVHVKDVNAEIKKNEDPSPTSLGTICCSWCVDNFAQQWFVLMCAHCVRDQGWA